MPEKQEIGASPEAGIVLFEPENATQAAALAKWLAVSSLLPVPLRGKPADVLVTLITGHELGLSPMQAIRGMHVIEGKAVASADLMVALVKRNREVCEYFRLIESTDTQATYETKRKGDPEPTRLAYTLEQAGKAGLLGKDNWKRHPAAMLRARCSSALCRAVYQDLTQGIYDPDEAAEFDRKPKAPPPRPEVSPEDAALIEEIHTRHMAAQEPVAVAEAPEEIQHAEPEAGEDPIPKLRLEVAAEFMEAVQGETEAARELLMECTSNGKKGFRGFRSVSSMKQKWQFEEARRRLREHPVFGESKP